MSNVIHLRGTIRRRTGFTFEPWATPSGDVVVRLDLLFAAKDPSDNERAAVVAYLRDAADMLDSPPGCAVWEGRDP